MRLKKKYLLLPVVTLAVILLCFLLPSLFFQIYDQEWTGKRVEKSANASGLSIDSMPFSEKITMIQDLDQIESALNEESAGLDAAILSRGYKLTKEEAWNNIIAEFMKLADDLESIMPEFYKYISFLQDYNDAITYFAEPGSIKAVLVTDQEGNSTIIWTIGFQMSYDFLNNIQAEAYASAYISPPYVELYYDESSGYLLGAEIYNLDIGDITSMRTIADAEWRAEWRDAEFPYSGVITFENYIDCYFLKRYAEYAGWPSGKKSTEWYPTSDAMMAMQTTKDNDTLRLTCSVYLDMEHFLNIKLNREN